MRKAALLVALTSLLAASCGRRDAPAPEAEPTTVAAAPVAAERAPSRVLAAVK